MNLTYTQLLETNNLIQQNTDETYWLCLTRTVQESKLFPVSPYMILSYFMCFYRYPSLLRKIEQHMKAEEIGDRARNMGTKIQNPAMGWCLPSFYLLGREYLIAMGMIRPQDAVEDVVYVMDFWKRFELAWHRNDGHMTNRDFGHRAQVLPERKLQIFHADLYDCAEGDPLHTAAQAFMAATSQYGFLVSCESRIALHNQGPYKLDDEREMIVRDFMDLAEGDYPWLDGVAADMPYNNLTVPMAVKGCHFNIIDDWGSFESQPEFKSHHMVGVGLYTSDTLSEGHVPVGMGSREELTRTFESLTQKAKEATTKLWQRIAGWNRDQMLDAGAITYFSIVKDLAHVAGCYAMEDWMLIDERAQLQLARESGVKVDEPTLDIAVESIARQNGVDVAELRRRVQADGMDYAQFRADLRDKVTLQKLREREVEPRVRITDQDVDQFIRDQRNSTDISALELNLAHVLVAVPENATAEQLATLQAKAQRAWERARAGEDFGALARELSDAQNRTSGGQFGLRSADRLPPLFVDATKNVRTGGIADIVRSGAGFHVLKVIEKRQAGLPSVQVVQTRVRHILLRPGPQLTESAALARLAEWRKRVEAKDADFAALAREFSQDGSAREGGDLGWANPGQFVPEFEEVVNGLAPGQIAPPVVSRFGAHLIQVLERREATLSEREQRDMARNLVREKKLDEAFNLWAQEVRGRAYVEIRQPPAQ